MKTEMTHDVPDGQVEITRHSEGEWFLVQIGRSAYTKRFNLRRSEAEQLIERLSASL